MNVSLILRKSSIVSTGMLEGKAMGSDCGVRPPWDLHMLPRVTSSESLGRTQIPQARLSQVHGMPQVLLCNPDLARAPSPPYPTVTVHHSTPILPSLLTPRSEIFVSCNIASLLFIWLVGFSGCRPFVSPARDTTLEAGSA